MKISEIVEKAIEEQGRTKTWVADKINTNYKTFIDRLGKNRLTASDILNLIDVLDLDLEELKEANRKSSIENYKLKFQLYPIDGSGCQLYYKEINENNIDKATQRLKAEIDNNNKALSFYKEDEIYKDKMTPEIESKIKYQVNICNDKMEKEISRLNELKGQLNDLG